MSSAAPQPGRSWDPGAARSRAGHVAGTAAARARLAVVPRPAAHASQAPFLLLVSLLLVGGVVGLLMFNTSMQQASFAERALEDQATALAVEEESLRVEMENLRDPQHIAEQAQRLGMVQPTSWCSLTLGSAARCRVPAAQAGVPLRLHEPPPVKPAALDPAPVVVHPHHDTAAASPVGGRARGTKGHKNHTDHTSTNGHRSR